MADKKRTARHKAKTPAASPGASVFDPRRSDLSCFCAIVAGAFFLRLVYLLQIESIPLFYLLAGDGRSYAEWAQRLAAGDWLGQGVFYQAPLYPYFLAMLEIVFGHDLWLIRFVQIILGALSCGLVYRVGQKLFSRNAGIAAGIMLAGYAPAIFFDGLIEKSILDLSLLSLLLFLLICVGDRHWAKWLGAGAVLALLGLSRENALILAPVAAAWIWFNFPNQVASMRARWLGLFAGGVCVVLIPVALRNLVVGGEFKLTTSQFGANFFIGNNPSADGTYGSVRKQIGAPQLEGADAMRLAAKAVGRTLAPGDVSGYWFDQARQYIQSQPLDWLGLLGRKWLMVWNQREIEDSDDFYIYQQWSWLLRCLAWFSHFGVLAPLAALGALATLKDWRRLWLVHAMILSLSLSVAVFYVFGRYRFPLVPLLALLAGAGVVQLGALSKGRDWRSILAAAAVLLSSALIVNWPILDLTGPGPGGYNNLANAYAKQGDLDQAINTALLAVAVQPDYGVAHYNLGNLYARQSRFDEAQRHFEAALRLYPNYAEAHSNYGQILAERGELVAGMVHFQKAIALDPSVSRAHLNLGVALAKSSRMDEAIAPLQQAATLDPEAAEPTYYLGSVYAAQHRYAEAEAAFTQALQRRPDFAPAHQSLAQLFALQGKNERAMQHHQEAVRLMQPSGIGGASR